MYLQRGLFIYNIRNECVKLQCSRSWYRLHRGSEAGSLKSREHGSSLRRVGTSIRYGLELSILYSLYVRGGKRAGGLPDGNQLLPSVDTSYTKGNTSAFLAAFGKFDIAQKRG